MILPNYSVAADGFQEPPIEMEAAREVYLLGQQSLPLTAQEEAERRAEMNRAQEEAFSYLDIFKKTPKMADKVITDARIYQQFRTHTGEAFPVSQVYGEFGHTMTTEEKIKFGVDIASSKSDFIFFTVRSRVDSAIQFKQNFEEQVNRNLSKDKQKRLLIIVIPDRYENQLEVDAGLVKKKIKDYVPSMPKWDIIKNNFTAHIDKKDRMQGLRWGGVTAGMYSAVFWAQGVSVELASAMILYGAVMTYFYTTSSQRIRNIFQANILKDFRVAGDLTYLKLPDIDLKRGSSWHLRNFRIPGTMRQATEQLSLSLITNFGGYGIGESVNPMEYKITEGQVVGNTLLSIGQTYSNMARTQSLTPDASRKFLKYINMTNIVMNAVIISGVAGFTLDLSYFEFTGMSLTRLGLHLLIGAAIYKNRAAFEEFLGKDLSKITRSSLIRLKRNAVSMFARSSQEGRRVKPSEDTREIRRALEEIKKSNRTIATRNNQGGAYIQPVGDKLVYMRARTAPQNSCRSLFR